MKKTRTLIALALSVLMVLSLTGCTSSAVKNTQSLIDAIGEVTVESGEAIIAAEEAYAKLSDKEKESLSNVDVLTEAREKLDVLLTEDLIGAIGEVTAESEAAVEAAEQAFNALSKKAQEKVSNGAVLKDARDALNAELAKKAILGTWSAETDAINDLVESIDSSLGETGITFADYLDSFPLKVNLEFREDGTYTVSGDKEAFDKVYDKLRESTILYYDDILLVTISSLLEESGYGSLISWEEIESFAGSDRETIINNALGMSIPELVDEVLGEEIYSTMMDALSREGRYRVEGNELHLSDSLSDEPVSAEYQLFTLKDDVLTLTDYEGSLLLADFEIYPIEFHRQG